MTANDLDRLVDKLADKLGVTADVLRPLAEETVAQVVRLGLIQTVLSAAALAAVPFLIRPTVRLAGRTLRSEDADQASAYFVGALICGTLALTCLLYGSSTLFDGLSRWLAPLPHLIRGPHG